jgi:hypothetical protein
LYYILFYYCLFYLKFVLFFRFVLISNQ